MFESFITCPSHSFNSSFFVLASISHGRLSGEIIMSALAELRRASSKDEEGLYDQLANKEGKENDSDSSLLPALELLVQMSLKKPGNEVALCPIDA